MKERLTQPEGNTATMTATCADRSSEHQENSKYDGSNSQAVSHRRRTQNSCMDWPRVLLAEDDDQMRRILARMLSAHGYAPIECRDGFDLSEHLERIAKHGLLLEIDAIVSDILMPGPTGLDVLEALHERPQFPPMILITGSCDKATRARAQKAGAAAVLEKPFRTDVLLAKLHEIAPCRRGKECDA